jgi:hypothetical protein
MVALWTSYNHHLVHIVSRIFGDKLQNLCWIGDEAPVTLEFRVVDYLRHLTHHLGQILITPMK